MGSGLTLLAHYFNRDIITTRAIAVAKDRLYTKKLGYQI